MAKGLSDKHHAELQHTAHVLNYLAPDVENPVHAAAIAHCASTINRITQRADPAPAQTTAPAPPRSASEQRRHVRTETHAHRRAAERQRTQKQRHARSEQTENGRNRQQRRGQRSAAGRSERGTAPQSNHFPRARTPRSAFKGCADAGGPAPQAFSRDRPRPCLELTHPPRSLTARPVHAPHRARGGPTQ